MRKIFNTMLSSITLFILFVFSVFSFNGQAFAISTSHHQIANTTEYKVVSNLKSPKDFCPSIQEGEDYFSFDGSGPGGTQNSPWLIKTASDLTCLSYLVNSGTEQIKYNNMSATSKTYYKLENNIDLGGKDSPYQPISGDKTYGWLPIGAQAVDTITASDRNAWWSNFDGNGKTISNLYIYVPSRVVEDNQMHYAGLFGLVRGGKISNLGIESGEITSDDAYCSDTNPYCESQEYAGGIAGLALADNQQNVEISNCYNNSSITSISAAGGIVGGAKGATANYVKITNCYNNAKITTNTYTRIKSYTVVDPKVDSGVAGGVVGVAFRYVTISESYNTGRVEVIRQGNIRHSDNEKDNPSQYDLGSYAAAGGVVGYIITQGNGAPKAVVTNCYNKGYIYGTANDRNDAGNKTIELGGIVGVAQSAVINEAKVEPIEITKNYNYGTINGQLGTAESDFEVAGVLGNIWQSQEKGKVVLSNNASFGEIIGVDGYEKAHIKRVYEFDADNEYSLNATISNNYGYKFSKAFSESNKCSENIIPWSSADSQDSDISDNGATITKDDISDGGFWGTHNDPSNTKELGFDQNVWNIVSGKLPTLKNISIGVQPDTIPSYLDMVNFACVKDFKGTFTKGTGVTLSFVGYNLTSLNNIAVTISPIGSTGSKFGNVSFTLPISELKSGQYTVKKDDPYAKKFINSLKSGEYKITVKTSYQNGSDAIDTGSFSSEFESAISAVSKPPSYQTSDKDVKALKTKNSGRYNAIIWMETYGIAGTYSESKTTYNPNGNVSREIMAQWMRRVVGMPTASKTIPKMSDISKLSKQAISDIQWLASEGITSGVKTGSYKYKNVTYKCTSTNFCYKPYDSIIRGAMAEFLWNLAGKPTVSSTIVTKWSKKIKDVTTKTVTSENRRKAIYWMAENGITKIGTDGKYNPQNKVNRGAMAEFIKSWYTKSIHPALATHNYLAVQDRSDDSFLGTDWHKANDRAINFFNVAASSTAGVCKDVSAEKNNIVKACSEDDGERINLYQSGGVVANPNSSYLFSGLINLGHYEGIITNKPNPLGNIDTNFKFSNIDDMSYMFKGSSLFGDGESGNNGLKEDFVFPAGFGKTATNMSAMFVDTYINPNAFPAGFGSAATNMKSMFYNSWFEPEEGWKQNTTPSSFPAGFGAKATDMTAMFERSLGFPSGFTFPAGFGSVATNMGSIFQSSVLPAALNAFPAGFGSKATNLKKAFAYMPQDLPSTLTEFPAGFGSVATNMSSMFEFTALPDTMNSLPENFGAECVDFSYMFQTAIIPVDLDWTGLKAVKATINTNSMFKSTLKSIGSTSYKVKVANYEIRTAFINNTGADDTQIVL